jgi:CelD/BcsL family acetyltransferase involved in cellulose biosynthesis
MVSTNRIEPAVVTWEHRSAFRILDRPWRRLLAEAREDAPHLRPGWFGLWCASFAAHSTVRLFTLEAVGARASDERRLIAVLPMIEEQRRPFGAPLRLTVWRSASNEHSPRFDLPAIDEPSRERLFERVLADPRWDLLELRDLPSERANRLSELARHRRFPTGTWRSLRSPYLTLPSTWDGLQARLRSKFKANLRRRMRRLRDLGDLRLERIEDRAELPRALEDAFALEAEAWKGEAGTAIRCHAHLTRFYGALARHSLANGTLALRFLLAGGRRVAVHYALDDGSNYYLLKPGYSADLASEGPGHTLVSEVLADLIGAGRQELDFLGDDLPWKREWTTDARCHAWLYVYRPHVAGRILQIGKFRLAPQVRRLVAALTRPQGERP